jgi:hypothetical protein
MSVGPVRPLAFAHTDDGGDPSEGGSDGRTAGRGPSRRRLSDRLVALSGLRPGAPRRNALLVLAYLIALLVLVRLGSMVGLPG